MSAPTRPRPATSHTEDVTAAPWAGPTRRYDLIKEFVVALVAVALLTTVLAVVFSSPDEKSITVRQWATTEPADFTTTAAAELAGTSGTATYGAPYTSTPGAGQKIGPLPLQRLGGVRQPIDSAQDFVVRPLRTLPNDSALAGALSTYTAAPAAQRLQWATAYNDAIAKAPDGDPTKVAPGQYGPVPLMVGRLADMARSGALDGALTTQDSLYPTDFTKPLLFLADGGYLEERARAEHLGGDQWGMMNETGRYPGQSWLWLYTFWYQVKPFSTSENADALVWGLMMVLTLGLVLVPFIPGLRSLPRHLGVYRLIWRDYYRHTEPARIPPRHGAAGSRSADVDS